MRDALGNNAVHRTTWHVRPSLRGPGNSFRRHSQQAASAVRLRKWHAISNNYAISASSPTSMPARRPSPSGCCIYSGASHRMGDVDKGTTVTDFDPEEQQRGHHDLRGVRHVPLARLHGQPDRHAGPRRFHGRGGAQPARARRRRGRVQRPRRRRSPERNRVAAGRQVRRAAAGVHQQDGPRRGRFRRARSTKFATDWKPIRSRSRFRSGPDRRT